jgi:hypothetical protein
VRRIGIIFTFTQTLHAQRVIQHTPCFGQLLDAEASLESTRFKSMLYDGCILMGQQSMRLDI